MSHQRKTRRREKQTKTRSIAQQQNVQNTHTKGGHRNSGAIGQRTFGKSRQNTPLNELERSNGVHRDLDLVPPKSAITKFLDFVLGLAFWLISSVGLGIVINILTSKTPLPEPLNHVLGRPWQYLVGALTTLGAISIGKYFLNQHRSNPQRKRFRRGKQTTIPTRETLIAKSRNLLITSEVDFEHIVNISLCIREVPRLVTARHAQHSGRRRSQPSESLNEPLVNYLLRMDRLLLVGPPGSGKTETIRTLCNALLREASTDLSLPIPFIVSLSTFSKFSGSLREWLSEALLESAAIPIEIGNILLQSGKLFLLLDGLDEMPAERRVKALRELNVLLRSADPALARCLIASRTQEYLSAGVSLLLPAAFELQEVNQIQVGDAVAKAGPAADPLAAALSREPSLSTVLKTPLLVTIAAYVFAGNSELMLANRNPAEFRQALFESYVVELFRRRLLLPACSVGKTLSWLRWLAQYLNQNQARLFFVERLQPSALASEQGFSLSFALACGCIISSICGFFGGAIEPGSIFSNLMFGLGCGILFGIFLLHSKKKIIPLERLRWSWLQAGSFWQHDLQTALVIGIPVALLSNEIYGVFMGLLASLGSFVAGGWIREVDEKARKPNQAIHSSIYNGLLEGLVSVLVVGLLGVFGAWASGLSKDNRTAILFGTYIGTLAGAMVALFVGLGEALKHYLLRFFLYLDGKLPLRLIPWLEHCRARLLLRRQNGAYLFWHETLQDYFAQLDATSEANLRQQISYRPQYESVY